MWRLCYAAGSEDCKSLCFKNTSRRHSGSSPSVSPYLKHPPLSHHAPPPSLLHSCLYIQRLLSSIATIPHLHVPKPSQPCLFNLVSNLLNLSFYIPYTRLIYNRMSCRSPSQLLDNIECIKCETSNKNVFTSLKVLPKITSIQPLILINADFYRQVLSKSLTENP